MLLGPRHVCRPGRIAARRQVGVHFIAPLALLTGQRRQAPRQPGRPAANLLKRRRQSRHRLNRAADADPDQGPFRLAHAALHGLHVAAILGWLALSASATPTPGGNTPADGGQPRFLGGMPLALLAWWHTARLAALPRVTELLLYRGTGCRCGSEYAELGLLPACWQTAPCAWNGAGAPRDPGRSVSDGRELTLRGYRPAYKPASSRDRHPVLGQVWR